MNSCQCWLVEHDYKNDIYQSTSWMRECLSSCACKCHQQGTESPEKPGISIDLKANDSTEINIEKIKNALKNIPVEYIMPPCNTCMRCRLDRIYKLMGLYLTKTDFENEIHKVMNMKCPECAREEKQ